MYSRIRVLLSGIAQLRNLEARLRRIETTQNQILINHDVPVLPGAIAKSADISKFHDGQPKSILCPMSARKPTPGKCAGEARRRRRCHIFGPDVSLDRMF